MNIRPQEIQIADYDYPLPDERIAKYPLADRSSSKLLRYQAGEIEEFTFRDLPRLLPEGAVLVRNNSKVKVHDENETAGVGDLVRIEETRPLSKDKHFRLVEIIENAR